MEYFDKENYNRIYNKYAQASNRLASIAMIWPQLGIGTFTQKTIEWFASMPWIHIQPEIEDEIKKPVLKELDSLNIKNRGIRESMLKNGCADALSTLSEIRNHTQGLSDCEPDAFVIQSKTGEVVISNDWEAQLRDQHTHKPHTDNQKKFAEIVERFQNDYQDLIKLLPSGTPVFGDSNGFGPRPLFRLQGQKIDYVDKSLLKRIK